MKTISLSAFITLLSLLIFNSLSAQIPNNGFENWTVDGNNDNNPDGWSTTNSFPDLSVDPYTPAYAGSFSMRVKTFDPGFMAIPGFAMIEFPFTARPNCFTACLKSNIMPGDGAYIIFSLWNGDSIIAAPGDCTFHIDSTISNFTCISFPITYISSLTPDSANIMVVAGTSTAQIGTEIIVDELSFGCSSDIENIDNFIIGKIYPNPASQYTYFNIGLTKPTHLNLFIYDLHGKQVKSMQLGMLATGDQTVPVLVNDLANGIYQYRLSDSNVTQTGKLVVNK